MILEIYTLGLNDIKKKGDLTADLLTQAYKKNCGNYKSCEEYRSYNLKTNSDKIHRAGPIIEFCKKNHIKKILSIGSGGAVTEIEIKDKLQNIEMVCTDYVDYICDKLSELHKDITFRVFDMKIDDPQTLGNNFDMVLFCGSDYVMNNKEYIRLLKRFDSMGIKYIYIVTSPYISALEKIKQISINVLRIIGILINYSGMRDGRVSNAMRGIRKGLFHGYMRDIKELKMIFNETGYEINHKQYTGVSKSNILPALCATHVNILLKIKS